MSRLMLLAAAACVVVGLASGRVLVDSPKQDFPSLDDLLQQSDPHENDIFSESQSRRVPASSPRGPPRPSPTQHLLDSLSMPRYVDASEFRRHEVLPPALDINRQLTLLSASKRIRPPVDFVQPASDLTEESSGTIYFPNTSPLFREDFSVQNIAEEQDNLKETSVVEEVIEPADEEPRISTSVSVSTSVAYSNESLSSLDSESSTDSIATDAPLTTSSTTTTTQAAESSSTTTQSTTTTTDSSPTVFSQTTTVTSDTPRSSKLVAETEIVLHPEERSAGLERSETHLGYEVEADYSDYSDYPDYAAAMAPLSPLAHVLSGFGSEFDSYGGDFGTREFISSFRPDGF